MAYRPKSVRYVPVTAHTPMFGTLSTVRGVWQDGMQWSCRTAFRGGAPGRWLPAWYPPPNMYWTQAVLPLDPHHAITERRMSHCTSGCRECLHTSSPLSQPLPVELSASPTLPPPHPKHCAHIVSPDALYKLYIVTPFAWSHGPVRYCRCSKVILPYGLGCTSHEPNQWLLPLPAVVAPQLAQPLWLREEQEQEPTPRQEQER